MTKQDLAHKILEHKGICPLSMTELLVGLISDCKEKDLQRFPKIKKILKLGISKLEEEIQSISFSKAVALSLEAKKHRRLRTVQEISIVMNRLMRVCPEIKKRPIRSLKLAECNTYLEKTFTTPRQFDKGRRILSGVFSVAIKHGYADANPMVAITPPVIVEQEIHALTLEEIKTLLDTARRPEHIACLPAMSIMLYAGIRPNEVERLTWNDIHLSERVITIRARNSKTGGARHVTILPPLEKILREQKPLEGAKRIIPACWTLRWRALRKAAGWGVAGGKPWQQDCLRHTFATYHVKKFRDYNALQCELGHRSSSLLRSRYVNLTPGITAGEAAKLLGQRQ